MSKINSKRLFKELKDFSENPPSGIKLISHDELNRWLVELTVPDSIYSEIFHLQFTFSQDYPLDSPQVIFINTIPCHPHVYSNGHICLSILVCFF